jgi:uncharacterized membrane protein (UPF0127 family)
VARVTDVTRGEVLAERALLAHGFLERARGLLGRNGWGELDGLWIEPCSGVHGLGMRFPIDVVVVDAAMTVVAVETLRPWRIGRLHLDAAAVLELPSGRARGARVEPGDLLALDEPDRGVRSVDTPRGRWYRGTC